MEANLAFHSRVSYFVPRSEETITEKTEQQIEEIVCNLLNVSVESAIRFSKCRKRELVAARQLSMSFYLEFYGKDSFATSDKKLSLAKIGEKIGGKDHATVLHAHKTVNNLIDTDKKYREKYNEIKEAIYTIKINDFYDVLNFKRGDIVVTRFERRSYKVRLLKFDFKDKKEWLCEVIAPMDDFLFNQIITRKEYDLKPMHNDKT